MKYPNMPWGTMEAVVNKLGGMDGVGKFLRNELIVRPMKIMERINTITVPGVYGFAMRERFQVGQAGIADLGNDFMQFFGDLGVIRTEGCDLNVYELTMSSLDVHILAELGNRSEISPAHLWGLLAKQSRCEDGPLHVNGWGNIFYIRGNRSGLHTVQADRDDQRIFGWRINTFSIADQRGQNKGYRIFYPADSC